MSISVAGSCPRRQGGIETGRIEPQIKQLRLTATESFIRVIPTVIDPVTEATVGHTPLVVARSETLPATPVVWTQ